MSAESGRKAVALATPSADRRARWPALPHSRHFHKQTASSYSLPHPALIRYAVAVPRGTSLDPTQGRHEIGHKFCKGPFWCGRSRDQHVVGSGFSAIRQDAPRRGPHSAFRAIAQHGIPDFSAGREANPDAIVILANRSRRRLQDQPRHYRLLPARSDSQKVRPELQRCKFTGRAIGCRPAQRLGHPDQAESRLRPFARRAAKTRRPAGVAILARKP
jgi:hypothetical protein